MTKKDYFKEAERWCYNKSPQSMIRVIAELKQEVDELREEVERLHKKLKVNK